MRSQSAYISSKYTKDIDEGSEGSNKSKRSITARLNVRSMQFGKMSEFVNTQIDENEAVDAV